MTVWRNRLASLAFGLFFGVAIGALVGWVLWPVQYYDTDLADMKAQHQDTYISMVSEQWALTHDRGQAQAALSLLSASDLPQRMEQAAQRLQAEGNEAAASRIRDLMEALKQP